ncbi:8879_t:CDS:2, partial [Paraglomus occultum]
SPTIPPQESDASQTASVIPETASINNITDTTNELSQSYFENNTLEIQPVAAPSGRQKKRQLEDDNSDNGDINRRRRDWSHAETLALIEVVSSNWKSLNGKRTNAEKARCWQAMFDKFSERIQGRTLGSFKKRWARLVEEYKLFLDNNKKTGAEPIEFDYEEEMREIFKDDPVFNPVYDTESREEKNSAKEQREKKRREKKEKQRAEVPTLIRDLHEQSLQQTAEFYDRLLLRIDGLIDAIKHN